MFLRHPGQVLSREQLLSHVWGYDFDPGSNVVDVYVGYLRRKLGTERIETVRGMGYRAGGLTGRRAVQQRPHGRQQVGRLEGLLEEGAPRGHARAASTVSALNPEMSRSGRAPSRRASSSARSRPEPPGITTSVPSMSYAPSSPTASSSASAASTAAATR